MIVAASTPGGLMSATLSAIQSYHASARQAEQAAAASAAPVAPSAGMTHLPAFSSAPSSGVQEGALPRAAVQQAQRAYEASLAATSSANHALARLACG